MNLLPNIWLNFSFTSIYKLFQFNTLVNVINAPDKVFNRGATMPELQIQSQSNIVPQWSSPNVDLEEP